MMSAMPITLQPDLALTAPLRWLRLGARDLARAPWPGLSHGLSLALFGMLAFSLLHQRFWALAGAFSGFMLVAPVLATGLYAVSRALERGQPMTAAQTMRTAIGAWWPRGAQAARLMRFGALLALAGTGWVLTSAAFVTGFAPQPITTSSSKPGCCSAARWPRRCLRAAWSPSRCCWSGRCECGMRC
jgi:uncharacterized membrane protein